MIESIKYKIGRYFLRRHKEPEQVNRKVINFNDIKSVIIFSEIENQLEWKEFLDARNKIRKDWGVIDVYALAYFSSNRIPKWLDSNNEITIECKKHTNVFGKPNILKDDKSYDLVLDFSNTKCIPILFHVKTTHAKLKVAKLLTHNKSYFDMFIKVADNKSFNYFFEQVENYLKIINKHN